MLLFEEQSFWDLWNPHMLAGLLFIYSIFLVGVGPLRSLFKESRPVTNKQKVLVGMGIFVTYIATSSPLHVLGDEYLFSAHMLNQSLVYMLVPPLILFGMPDWMLRSFLKWGWIQKLFRFLTHPIMALLLFNVIFSFYHIPAIFDFVVENGFLHNFTHTALIFAAFLLWIPMISPLKEWYQLSYLQKIGYIFASSVLLYPACALIIFANSPLYTTYMEVPQLFSLLTTFEDQQLGGIVMKIIQEIIYGSFLGYLVFKWAKEERSKDKEVAHLINATKSL
jgi:putative membrane protein